MNHLTKSRYLELLEKQKISKLNNSEQLEFSNYGIILETQWFYKNRSKYIDLIKTYIDGKINCYAFQWDFFSLYNDHLMSCETRSKNLNQYSTITFDFDLEMENFVSLVEDLVPLCEFLDEGVTPERFDQEIKKIYSEIQKYI